MQQGNIGPGHKMAVTSEEGEDNREQHQRMKQETGATYEKSENIT
jgi:hypothetical protein